MPRSAAVSLFAFPSVAFPSTPIRTIRERSRRRTGVLCDVRRIRVQAAGALHGRSYALVNVDPCAGESWVKIYGRQSLAVPLGVDDAAHVAATHLLARIRLH